MALLLLLVSVSTTVGTHLPDADTMAARSFKVESVAVLGSSPIVRADTAAVAWPSGTDDLAGDRAMAMAWANGTTMVSTSGGHTWARATGGIRFIPGNGHGVQNSTSVRNVGGGAGMPEGYTCPGSPCEPVTGPFRTQYAETATIDLAARTFSWGVDRASADQAEWQSPPNPVVEWSPGSGGMVALGGGVFLGTPVVWYSNVPMRLPQGPRNTWGACCNGTVLAYISRDGGKSFRFRSEIASKATVLKRWPTIEGPNENDVIMLPNRSVLCIIRKDGGDGRVQLGGHGPHVPYLFAMSNDIALTWTLQEAPSFMLSARPRAVALANGAILVAGGRPALNFWVSVDSAKSWEVADIPTEHNLHVADEYKFCSQFENANMSLDWSESSCYTQIVALSPSVGMVCYERQGYNGASGWKKQPETCNPGYSTIFCMRVKTQTVVNDLAANLTDNAAATVRLKQDDAVSTMHHQDKRGRGGDYPDFVATDNPLAGLPALSKPHYSFGRYNLAGNGSGIDNRATLVDYARITSAFPVVPELSETAVRKAVGICQDAIKAGGGNCSLSISWSPYISQTAPSNFPNGSKVPYAVNVTTALELKILKELKAYLANVTCWAADQSRIGKVSVGVGAILLDQEVFQTGSSLDPAIRKATSQKNNAYYNAAKQACPLAEVIQYNRGGWNPCSADRPVCPIGYRNGTEGDICTHPSLKTAPGGIWPCTYDGWSRFWWYTLDPDEMGDSLSLQVYSVPEIRNTVKAFNRTVHSAAKLGLNKVAPWICLGCGFRRDVIYPNGGSVLFRTVWDYDVSYSFLLGAIMHEKLPYNGPKRPQQFGDWSYAKFGVFYPSIVDTEQQNCNSGANPLSPCKVYTLAESREVRLRHFVAYVRGAALFTGNLSQGRPECANATQRVLNQTCLEALYPAPPPPPPPLPVKANPLAGLAALPKPHYSWYRSHAVDVLRDNRATLIDYARITHSFPVCHGGGGAPDHGKSETENAVAICIAAGGNCSISVDTSPYINELEKEEKRIDPRTTTPNELASLAKFKLWADNVTRWAANASKVLSGGKYDIKVGAVGFDQEQLCGYCWSQADDGTCNASTYDALTAKNNLYYDAAAEALPDAEIIWFSKGGYTPCTPSETTCTKFGAHGVCEEKKASFPLTHRNCDSEGWAANECYSLSPQEKGDSYSVALYTVGEIGATVDALNRTVQNALAHGIHKVVPYIDLGGGYRRDVLYPLGGSYIYQRIWDYDTSYSFLLGAMVNSPRFLAEPERFGPWHFVKSVVLFPSQIDTERDTCTGPYAPGGAERNDASPCFAVTPEDARNIRLKHFVAYVQGAATNATTGISPWPPRLKLDDRSSELARQLTSSTTRVRTRDGDGDGAEMLHG